MSEKVKVPKVFDEWLKSWDAIDIDTTKGKFGRIEAISAVYRQLMWDTAIVAANKFLKKKLMN